MKTLTYNDIEDSNGSRVDFNEISLESMGMHLMFGEINDHTMKDAINFVLKANMLLHSDIALIINTLGGDVSEGFALIDVMEASRLDIKTVGMGSIISMGMLVICAGTKGKRVMMKNSSAMAHQFTGWTYGKFHELVSTQKAFEYLKLQMVSHFRRHTKMTEAQVMDIMFGATDRYLTPTECKKYGIIDHIVDELPELDVDLNPYNVVPRIKRKIRKTAS